MMSLRNKGDDAVLDAARDCILEVGVRRTTLTAVASRAGVSRMTVYRRHRSTPELLATLMTREFGEQLALATARSSARRSGRARLVAAVAAAAEGLAAHPLLRRVLELDPELLLPYLTRRLGETQRLAQASLQQLLAEGQQDRSVRSGDPRLLAWTLLLVIQPFILCARIPVPGAPRSAQLAELALLVDRYLKP
jgi:AcrR family transcriptional regulator